MIGSPHDSFNLHFLNFLRRRDQARSMRRIEGNLRYDINEANQEMTFDIPLTETWRSLQMYWICSPQPPHLFVTDPCIIFTAKEEAHPNGMLTAFWFSHSASECVWMAKYLQKRDVSWPNFTVVCLWMALALSLNTKHAINPHTVQSYIVWFTTKLWMINLSFCWDIKNPSRHLRQEMQLKVLVQGKILSAFDSGSRHCWLPIPLNTSVIQRTLSKTFGELLHNTFPNEVSRLKRFIFFF